MKKLLLLMIVCLITYTSYSNETVVKVKAPGYKGLNVLKANKSDMVFVGTWGDGIYTSTNGGQAFQTKNNGLNNLYINDIVFDSKGVVYVGTQGDGIYVSKNDGNLWTKLSFDSSMNVTSIYVSRFDDNTIYVGTYGSGLFVSKDAGTTWASLNRSKDNNGQNVVLESMHITAIALTMDSTLLAGSYGDGVYRSTDKGDNWRRANSGTNNTKFINQISVISSDIILMATNDKGLMESNNDALQWVKYQPEADSLKDNGITCFEYTSEGAVVGTRENGIWFYNAQPYTEWLPSILRNFGVVDMTQLSNGTLLAYDFDRGLVKSTNKGKNWDKVSLDPYGVTSFIVNTGSDFVLNVNDKMYKSSNLGTDWTELTNYPGGMVNRLKYVNGNLIGINNNDAVISTDKGNTWTKVTPGDNDDSMMDLVVAPNGDVYSIIMFFIEGMPPTVRQELYKSTDGGAAWTRIQNYPDDASSGCLLEADANNNIYLFRPDAQMVNKLFKSTDGGATFSNTGYSLNKTISKLSFAYGNLYAATYEGLYVSKNNATSFSKLDIPIAARDFGQSQPDQSVASFVVASANELYVGLSQHWGVYHSTNGGVEWDSLQSGYHTGRIYEMAVNSDADLMFSGSLLYKYNNRNKMGVPQLASPINESLNQPLDLSFDWSTSGKADLYNFQISANKSFTFSYEDIITANTYYDIFYKLNPNTKYFFRVRGKTGGVYSNWSSVNEFTTLIGPPTLIEPVKDTISVSHTPTFLWSSVKDADKYKLIVATDAAMTNVVLTKTGLTDTTYTLAVNEKLTPLTHYYWAAVVEGEDGSQGQLSEIWKFRTVLAAPVLTLPLNNAANQPDAVLFTWKKVDEAVDYQIQISRFADFSIPAQDNQTLGAVQQPLSELEANANYYWRVRATDTNHVKGPWSEIWSFKTGQERPMHISPANNSGGHQAPVLLDWSEIKGYKYDLQVSLKPEFSGPFVVEQSALPDHNFELTSVETNKTYYWRVRAVLNDTVSPWTVPWNFSTGLARTALLAPANGSIDIEKKSVLFKWETTPGAETYNLQISKNESFTNLFYNDSNITTNSKDVYDFEEEQTYYWRVMAFEGETGNDWSEEWSFTTEDAVIGSVLSASESGISIYPNPAGEEVTINIPVELAQNIDSATLISQTGQELRTVGIITSIQQLSLANLTSGTYYLILEGKGSRYMFNLNKIK
ncbi:MAG: T9SS type A sorting domain-containing protein [Candidatus Kapaibacterium sp.]